MASNRNAVTTANIAIITNTSTSVSAWFLCFENCGFMQL